MAKVERVETDVICDRPGCGKRVTEKGGAMWTVGHNLAAGVADPFSQDHVDLCRECLQQMGSAWNRKADGE
jgi:hypothetical protein